MPRKDESSLDDFAMIDCETCRKPRDGRLPCPHCGSQIVYTAEQLRDAAEAFALEVINDDPDGP